ncbi:serine hydrolase domain-containing protein [Pseudalkalibacillus berkeleyi]|uniref:Beta-lactamase family protein n=1 Tax=Pseudalkalibacillus berkeleyi TaxID=1069813 RepID=A0ABS9GY89_9BACL|nr:serine hydrolase [Pseudalkalibacillus berkeleyi]MCF6137732.1 beta-lactamase family protein [Pseudalkalibacillus berkeleyi]
MSGMELRLELDGIIDKTVPKVVPGCVLKVMSDGVTLYEKAAGHRQTFPSVQPVTLGTVFDIASLTKIITTTMVLKLISDGKFRIDTKLVNLLDIQSPELKNRIREITIFELLTHSSGLVAWYPFYTGNADFFKQLEHLGADLFHMGKDKVVYSDLNFILLGKVIEKITRLKLGDAFHELIKVPLEFTSMRYGPIEQGNVAATEFGNPIEMKMCESRALAFDRWRSTEIPICGEVNDGNTYYFFNGVSGHAGLFSNMEDVCDIGRIYTQPSFAEKVGIKKQLIQEVNNTSVGTRSIGFEKSSIFPEGFGHTGFTGTSLYVHPNRNLVVILLTNRLHQNHPPNINNLRRTIHEAVLSYA